MTQHVSAPFRRRAIICSTFSAVALFLSRNSTRKAITDRLQSLASSANERRMAGHTNSRMPASRLSGARSALAARVSGGPVLDPPVMMRLVPPSSRATSAAAEALKQDRAQADREWMDAWKRMPPAEKRKIEAGWKREWDRIQAERRRRAGVHDGLA